MKIARIALDGAARWSIVEGDTVRTSDSPVELADVASAALDRVLPLAEVTLLPPVLPTAKVLCVGLNYRDHVLEMGREMPTHPVLFTRFPDTFVAPGAPMVLPKASDRFDYEGEFAIVIGRAGRAIDKEDALEHVLGYTILNDGSLRDYQAHTIQFTPGKNFADSGSVGPWIVSAEEFGPVTSQRVRTTVDGEVRQDSSLDQLVFDVATLVEYVSTWTPLRPGDIIATGTPGGVGAGFTPPKFLKAGSTVEIEIDGIGILRNPIVTEEE
ncbi:fumarylacetoacetate hydrolase family protein [Salinibacterium sp. GXW1014]|uniref:fumarylacetoacetate hydrolase family protein n=1 Tax=Salinibacterium sp. GXW1014 TaxID=3377838 RepID=UPI00383B48A7